MARGNFPHEEIQFEEILVAKNSAAKIQIAAWVPAHDFGRAALLRASRLEAAAREHRHRLHLHRRN
jgi:hypothetical protein